MTKEEKKEYMKSWWLAHPGYKNKWRKEHPESVKEEIRKRALKPGYKERHCKANIEWAKKNKWKCTAKIRAYKQRKEQSCPKWVNLKEIEIWYDLAKRMEDMFGIKYHVDHFWPLQHNNFCGLHVPWNLQLLPARENCSKGNNPPTKEECAKKKSHSLITN